MPKKRTAAKPKARLRDTAAKRKSSPRKPRATKAPAAEPTRTRASFPLRKWVKRAVIVGSVCVGAFLVVSVSWVTTYRYVDPPMTALMLLRHLSEDQPIDKVWCDYEDISPHFLVAVLAAEDQRFYDHHGFDVEEIKNALEERASGGRMRGASTLSQQTAKNVFLWPTRSWWRKGVEAYFTVLVEWIWPKRRILEVYVNVAEMGPGVYGVESAVRRYYGVSAASLTRDQAALLASIIPSPLTRNPNAPTPELLQRRDWILKQMDNLGGSAFLR